MCLITDVFAYALHGVRVFGLCHFFFSVVALSFLFCEFKVVHNVEDFFFCVCVIHDMHLFVSELRPSFGWR